ncbi:hypothetical protein GCM10009736_71210 [Actinomadura bangladeshensis]
MDRPASGSRGNTDDRRVSDRCHEVMAVLDTGPRTHIAKQRADIGIDSRRLTAGGAIAPTASGAAAPRQAQTQTPRQLVKTATPHAQ